MGKRKEKYWYCKIYRSKDGSRRIDCYMYYVRITGGHYGVAAMFYLFDRRYLIARNTGSKFELFPEEIETVEQMREFAETLVKLEGSGLRPI